MEKSEKIKESELSAKEKNEMFIKEIRPIIKKYGYKNISICGIDVNNEEKLFASVGLDKETIDAINFTKCMLCIARLYQFGRERLLNFMDIVIKNV